MLVGCIGGPVGGAVFVLSLVTADQAERESIREPDGLCFDLDEDGVRVRHLYQFSEQLSGSSEQDPRTADFRDPAYAAAYKYVGPVEFSQRQSIGFRDDVE